MTDDEPRHKSDGGCIPGDMAHSFVKNCSHASLYRISMEASSCLWVSIRGVQDGIH
jgi:hypothetical protein